ncbi:MAG: glycerol-3-phosphate dehydrogenase/oxidase [Candidatus Acidiferrales bacterium]
MKTREEVLQSIANQTFDVCVIGGGASGAGCALDARLRGLTTLLLEALDFASATSSASTKMAHGGVRYLEQAIRKLDYAQYRVLKRSLRERIHMLRNAPFLTRTRHFLTPCSRWSEVAYFEAGLKLYDWIAGDAGLEKSRFVSRDEACRRLPALASRNLAGAVAYADGQFDDARYGVSLVQTFRHAGGEAVNYARVTAFEKDATGKIVAASVDDSISGREVELIVRARSFVNATGPFSDSLREMSSPGIPPRVRLSKGVHILLPLEIWSSSDALLIPKTDDGRVLFAIPWMGRLLVGTTETEVGIHDEIDVTREEVEYLLRHLNRYLFQPVSANQIVSAFAGVRPLVMSGTASASRSNTKSLARDHVVELDVRSGLISLMGGKWTTYRAMAEDAIDQVQKYLGVPITPAGTRNHALLGSVNYTADYWKTLVARYGVSELTARHLSEKYGTQSPRVLEIADQDRELAAPLVAALAPVCAEVVFGARDEMAMSIEDILARRIGLEWYGWREAVEAAPMVAKLLGRELGWSEAAEHRAAEEYICAITNKMDKAGITTSSSA